MSELNLGQSFHNWCTVYQKSSAIFFTHPEFAVYPSKTSKFACCLAHSILDVKLVFCNQALLTYNCPPACSLLWVWTFDGTSRVATNLENP